VWEVRNIGAEAPHLFVDWRESGVPEMPDGQAVPRGGGYGRELIERALPHQLGARTSYEFKDDGIHCTIEVDVPSEDGSTETDDD
jgi:two-component system CheB/CheR fusion protein